MKDFEGLTALVTGAASGIGAATADLLLSRGARVAALDRDVTAIAAAVPDRAAGSPPAALLPVRADVTDDAAVRAGVDAAVRAFGGLDIVVNNAGVGAQGGVEAQTDEEWHALLDVNLLGAVRVTRAALPYLRRSGSAAIVNTCSVVATTGVPNRALYSASKGALLALTLAMAADHVAEGIRVNAVTPGTADTPWVGRLLQEAADPAAERAMLEARQPMGRLVSPAQVAAAIAYLAGPASASTTGTVLAVDGGMASLRLPR